MEEPILIRKDGLTDKVVRKQKRILIISVFCVVMLFAATSYALLTSFDETPDVVTFGTADLHMTINNVNGLVDLSNKLPESNKDGQANATPIRIDLTNTGTMVIGKYDVMLVSEDGTSNISTLDEEYIRFAISEDGSTYITGRSLTDPENVVFTGYDLAVGATKTIYLKVWIDEKAGNKAFGKTYFGSIKVELYQNSQDFLMVATNTNSDGIFLNTDLIKNTIEEITFMNTKVVPNDALGSFDVSQRQNNSVMLWYYDIDENGLYEVYIGGKDGVYANPNSSNLFYILQSLIKIDFTYFYVTKDVTNLYHMFYFLTSLTTMDVSKFDTSRVTNMGSLFWHVPNLENLDVSSWDTSNVTNMSSMFSGLSKLISLDVSNFDTSNVTRMDSMFSYLPVNSLDVSNFDTSNVTSMSHMFSSVQNLTSLDVSNFDTSNVTTMYYMFYFTRGLTSLDLSNFDTTNVTTMFGMFFHAENLISLDVSNFDTSNVTNVSNMFSSIKVLTDLNLSSFAFTSVTVFDNMFYAANSNLRVTVKDQASYDFIYGLLNATQKPLLTIKN